MRAITEGFYFRKDNEEQEQTDDIRQDRDPEYYFKKEIRPTEKVCESKDPDNAHY